MTPSQTLAQAVTLLTNGHTADAIALLDGSSMDGARLILEESEGLFGRYLANRDFERAGCVAALAMAASGLFNGAST